jgi:hypothetical protein
MRKIATPRPLPFRSSVRFQAGRLAALGLLLSLALASPAYPRQYDVNKANNPAYRKAAKKAEKGMRKYAKQQRKTMKKAAKAQKKALKRAQRNNPHY